MKGGPYSRLGSIVEDGKLFLRYNAAALRKRALRFNRFVKSGFRHDEIKYPLVRFGNSAHQYFYGYYDIGPFNHDETILLALSASSKNVSPNADDLVQAGYFRIEDPDNFCVVGETNTWCWQQGCRLQWYPPKDQGRSQKVFYNKLINGRYGSVVRDIQSRVVETTLPWPLYSLDPDGRYGLTLNFSRLHRLRPGYGYAVLPDETIGQLAPTDDGIWHVNLQTGEERLILSVRSIAGFQPLETMNKAEHYFNHICINPDGTRFLFFHVWVQKGKRYTRLITCNPDGSEPYPLINEGHVSHYTWKSPAELLCFSTHADTGMKYHLYQDKSNRRTVVGAGILKEDGHPSFSKNGENLLTDTYPDQYGDRKLLLYNLENESVETLGSFFSPYCLKNELRCDLHPRWSPSGKYVAFDSSHDGKRSLYMIRVPEEITKQNQAAMIAG